MQPYIRYTVYVNCYIHQDTVKKTGNCVLKYILPKQKRQTTDDCAGTASCVRLAPDFIHPKPNCKFRGATLDRLRPFYRRVIARDAPLCGCVRCAARLRARALLRGSLRTPHPRPSSGADDAGFRCPRSCRPPRRRARGAGRGCPRRCPSSRGRWPRGRW